MRTSLRRIPAIHELLVKATMTDARFVVAA